MQVTFSPARLMTCAFLAIFVVHSLPAQEKEAGENIVKGWGRFIDPDGDCKFTLQEKKVTLHVPGTPHNLSAELNRMNSPRVLMAIEGDFIMQVKVSGLLAPAEGLEPGRKPYQGAGILLMHDDKNYATLMRAALADGAGGTVFRYANFELRKDAKLERFGHPRDFTIPGNGDTWLRIERHGAVILGSASHDGEQWTSLPTKKIDLPKELRIGIAAVNSTNVPFDPQFSELKLFSRAELGE